MIETPPEVKINGIIYNFIKTAKIAQNILIKNIDQGGLKLCHYLSKVHALKLSRIKRLCCNKEDNCKTLPKLL